MEQKSSMTVEEIAELCHETNRAWCHMTGDKTQVAWSDAPDWQRESAINGVKFAMANPNAPDSAQHDAWMADKFAHGWTLGDVKDPIAKTHPCLVSFDELPWAQKIKDRLFRSVVRAMT